MKPIHRALVVSALLLAAALPTVSAKTFRFAYEGDVATMDPQGLRETFSREFVSNIMEPLLRYNRKMQLEPGLAERWEQRTPTVWRFHLRRNVKFTNGNAFTADDVIFTIDRGRHPSSPFRGNLNEVKEVRKIDDHTVDIETHAPHPLLLRDLPAVLIFDKEWVESHNAAAPVDPSKNQESHLTRNVLGTGPFMLKEYQPDVKIVLVPNPNWWDKKEHNITEAIFTPIKSDATRVAALLSGELDMIFPAPLQDIDRINRSGKTQVLEAPELRTLFIGMDMKSEELRQGNVKGKNPLKDKRVRQAMMHAIDVKLITSKVMRGHAVQADVIMSKELNGYDPRLAGRPAFDLAVARKLLAEAGYPKGFSVGLDCPNDRYVNDEEVCVAVVAMLARIGIDVKLTAQNKNTFFKKMLSGNSDMFFFGWASATTLDAHSYLKDIMHTPDGKHGTWNPGGYSNPRVDQLERLVATETNEKKRNEMIYEAFKLHKEDIGHIPLHTQTLVWAVRKGVKVALTPVNVLWLRWVTID